MSHLSEPRIIIGAGSTPIGPASGDLSGTYPAPQVIRINGAIGASIVAIWYQLK